MEIGFSTDSFVHYLERACELYTQDNMYNKLNEIELKFIADLEQLIVNYNVSKENYEDGERHQINTTIGRAGQN